MSFKLAALEFKKLFRNGKALALPVISYLLVLSMMHVLVSGSLQNRAFLVLFLSLSLKLSFGSILQDGAEQSLLRLLVVKNYPLGTLVIIKVTLVTVVYSLLYVVGALCLNNFCLNDLLLLPGFVGLLVVLQVIGEILTLRLKSGSFMSYLLLLPLEIPLLILMVNDHVLTFSQLGKAFLGLVIVAGGSLYLVSTLVLKKYP